VTDSSKLPLAAASLNAHLKSLPNWRGMVGIGSGAIHVYPDVTKKMVGAHEVSTWQGFPVKWVYGAMPKPVAGDKPKLKLKSPGRAPSAVTETYYNEGAADAPAPPLQHFKATLK